MKKSETLHKQRPPVMLLLEVAAASVSRQAALSHGAGWGVATLDDDVDDGMMMMMMSQGCGPAFPLAGPLYPSNCLFNSGESCA